jgi:hypothetical protein
VKDRNVNASYTASSSKATSRIGARLSPRRKLYAQRLLDYLNIDRHRWRTGQIRFDDDTYARLRDPLSFGVFVDKGLDRFSANQALDDLFELGLVDIRIYSGAAIQFVLPLAASIEEAA